MVLTMIRSIDFDSWYWFWIIVLLNQTHTRGPSVARMRNLYQYKPHYHPQGHVSAWCKEHCNPRNVPELNSVNIVICEQVKFLSTFLFTNILYISISLPRYKGWKLMFLIRVFGSYKKLLILIYDSKHFFLFFSW